MDRIVHKPRSQEIDVSTRADVVVAQGRARLFAAGLGFHRREQWEIATAVSEAATNIIEHGVRGTVSLHDLSDGLPCMEFVASDQGLGIEDVDRALLDGVSEPGAGGLGCGLGAISRLMDGLTIAVAPGGGTIVRAHKRGCGRASDEPKVQP